ncbi:hypothetical protein [Citrobacter sp. JGM124]|uniref:hypothetical protein n=1 Tax=Citrobacter sp. JGM124 TaxID=2799789 RepID=UPI001BA5ACFE|nr:hypothetical protein [Citrobacter sp. JGM124]MBS0847048.1 hypothetical protein [Citrobacter sp. JGM124]
MKGYSENSYSRRNPFGWLTIPEVKYHACQRHHVYLSDADIYIHALNKRITLSIFFQSPIFLKKINRHNNKLKFRTFERSQLEQLCYLESDQFILNRKIIYSTEQDVLPIQGHLFDTSLMGFERVLIQQLLASSLGIPISDDSLRYGHNFGITVKINDDIFQLFEKCTTKQRYQRQLLSLPNNITSRLRLPLESNNNLDIPTISLFPIYHLPKDACFVIRQSEIEKLLTGETKFIGSQTPTPRITTPLSRLFWLSCKYNQTISSLINQPYKLLPIFEQWAKESGIADKFSGDTLKQALARGAPAKK